MTEMIQPTGSGVGAFVNGIDLAGSLSDNMVGELRNALGEHAQHPRSSGATGSVS